MGCSNKAATAAATLDNSSLNESELIELIRRQMKQKNITLDSFVDIYDHDDDNLNSNGSEGNESDELQEQVIDDDDDDAQPEPKNNRLSTILEASCEESPFKKVTLVNRPSSSAKASLFNSKAQTSKYTKIETVSEENDNDQDDQAEQELSQAHDEDNNDENEDLNEQAEPHNRNPTALDIDSLPIGVKPTNKMSFEQLIEEKLKIADQLEQEQREMAKIKKKPLNLANINKTRQQFLQAKMAKEAKFPAAPAQPAAAAKQPQQAQQQPPQEEPEQPVKQLNREPRRYLRRGEGLKRYQGGRERSKSNSNSKSGKEPAPKPMSRVTSSSSQLKSASSTTLAPSSQSCANPKLKKSISASNMTAAGQKEPPLKKSSSLKSSTSTSSLNPSTKAAAAAKKPEPAAKPKPPTKSSEDLALDDELSEFEQLEQYVDEHPSFRSTTSFVDAVLTSKKSSYFNAEEDGGSEAASLLLSNLLSSLSKQQLNSLSSSNKFNLMLSMLNSNQGNKLAGLTEDDETDSSANNNINNNSDDIEHSELELEKESEKQRRLSENSTTSSKVVVVRKIKRIQNTGNEESSLPETHKKISYSCLNYKDDDYNENYDLAEPDEIERNEDEYFSGDYKMTSSRSSSQERVEAKLKYQPQSKPSQELKFDDASSWSDEQAQDKEKNVSKLIGKLFPSIREQQEKIRQQKEQEQALKDKEAFEKLKQQQMSSISSSGGGGTVQADSSLLKQKLAQLEAEIERFQKKNSELAKLKEKCEIEIKLAETNRKLLEKQKEDEMKKMREEHDEESRKLKLEKKIFEEYKKSIKDNPDRRERDDIERLKKQVSYFFFCG